MNIYLSAPAGSAGEACFFGRVSLMAYRTGAGFHLYRTVLPSGHFHLMDVDCTGFTGYGPHEALILELLRECRGRGYSGVVLSLSARPTQPLVSFCELASQALSQEGIDLYLPLTFASFTDKSRLLVPARILSSGFSSGLNRLCSRYGPGRLALELERVYIDYTLPLKSGMGTELSEQACRELAGSGHIFTSSELVCRYVSCIHRNRVHLVMWDDAETLREKLNIAQRMDIAAAFLYYPHIRDIASQLI